MAKKNGVKSSVPTPLPDTRWGGLHIMINQYLEHCESAIDLAGCKEYLVKRKDLEVMKDIRDLVKPIHECILRLEKDSSLASEIIPAMIYIKNQASKNNSSLAKVQIVFVEDRITDCLLNRRLLCTMILDDRFAFNDRYISPITWNTVETYLEHYDDSDVAVASSASDPTDVDDNFDSFMLETCTNSSGDATLETEILKFRALLASNRPSHETPLEFWKSQQENFKKLSKIAMILFGAPRSSAVCERTFSNCTDFLRQLKRNRSTVDTLNSVLRVSELAKSRRTSKMNEGNDS